MTVRAGKFVGTLGAIGLLSVFALSEGCGRNAHGAPSVLVGGARSGGISGRLYVAGQYRQGGELGAWVALRSTPGSPPVACLDMYQDFHYRLVDSSGRSIPTVDLTHKHLTMASQASVFKKHPCAMHRAEYFVGLFDVYPHLPIGQYRLSVSVLVPKALPLVLTTGPFAVGATGVEQVDPSQVDAEPPF